MGAPSVTCPAPQADRLCVVAAVVDAISAGCETAEEIADAIGMTGRQGGYYPNAAWTLGYAEPVEHTSPVQWQLTARGERFAGLGAADRGPDLTEALLGLEEMATFTAGAAGADDLALTWTRAGYSTQTVARRLQTIGAWAEFLTADPDDQARDLEVAATSTRDRAPHAKQRAESARAARQAEGSVRAAAPEPAQGSLCPRCFIVGPVTGGCPTCD